MLKGREPESIKWCYSSKLQQLLIGTTANWRHEWWVGAALRQGTGQGQQGIVGNAVHRLRMYMASLHTAHALRAQHVKQCWLRLEVRAVAVQAVTPNSPVRALSLQR